jgi:two-component system sensor histidine kinase KdpD
MSRLEAGVIQPKVDWCDGNEVVYSVLTDLKDISNNHQIVFEPRDALPLLQLDEGMFRQIIHNLVHNALRYTPVHSVVTIVLSNNSTHCLLEVSDNGPGFPPDEVDKVFEQFYRLKSSPSGGTGLGLSIVRGFVKAMNGEIALIAEPMGGAHFKVMLPCSMAHSRHNEHE